MKTKNYNSTVIFSFKGATEGVFIRGKIKRLISTEDGDNISFWVDGDRNKADLIATFNKTIDCPIFAKIDNTGPKKDDWVIAIVTVNTNLVVPDFPYENVFDSQVLKTLQGQGLVVTINYYVKNAKKSFVLNEVNPFLPEKPNIKELIYTGGLWGKTINFNRPSFSEIDPSPIDMANVHYCHVESFEEDIIYDPIELLIGDSPSNSNILTDQFDGQLPYYHRVTRVPKYAEENINLSFNIKGVSEAIKKHYPYLQEENYNDERNYLIDIIIDKSYIRTENQCMHITPMLTSYFLNNREGLFLGEIIKYNLFEK